MKERFKKVISVIIVLAIVLSQMAIMSFATDYYEVTLGAIETTSFNESNYYTVQFTPTESGIYIVTSDNGGDDMNIDPLVTIYDSDWNELGRDDDGGEGYNFSCDFRAEAGKTYYIELYTRDYNFEYYYSVSKSPFQSVSVEPMVLIENSNGYWETDWYGNEFYYYEGIYGSNFDYTVTLTDGTVLESEWGYIYYNDESYCLDVYSHQYETPFVLGENEISVDFMGVEGTAIVEIVENPFQSVSVEPMVLIENSNGNWETDWDGNEFYYYEGIYGSNFDYTVTLKDGTVLESEWGWIYYNDESYCLNVSHSQYETPFVLGENEIAVEFMGVEGTAIVEIIETPVVSITVEPITLIENANGHWETDLEGNEFFSYSFPTDDFKYTVTLNDGTILESESGEIWFNNSWHYLDVVINQEETPLVLGENEVTVEFMGVEGTVIVEIIENPVVSITVEPITLIENANGYWETDWYGNEFFYYDGIYSTRFDYTVTLKDGTVLESEWGYIYYNDASYYLNLNHYIQYESPFVLGENEIPATFMGVETTAIVEIVENPVASVTVEPFTLIENVNGYWENDYDGNEFFYYYGVDGDRFDYTVTLKDGTVLESEGGWVEINNINYCLYLNYSQYELPLVFGENEIPATFMGVETTAIVEVVESPIASINVEDTITINEYTHGEYDWNNNYRYNLSSIIDFTVTMKDGTVLTPYTDDWGDCYIEYFGNEYWVRITSDQDWDNPWYVGEHTAEISVLGTTKTVNIEIVSDSTSPFFYDEVDGGVVITGLRDERIESFEIPETIDGKPVIGIALLRASNATEIIVPDNVKFLSKNWLYRCYNVQNITLGKSVYEITQDMFSDFDSLESITVAEDNPYYKSIDGAVYTKDGKTLVVYPLGKGDTYVVPAGVTNIDLILTNSIYDGISVEFADESTGFVTVDGVTYTADMETVVKCNPSKTGDYIMPSTVTTITDRAFAGSSLENVQISENVNEIVYGAFADCSSLQSVEIPESVESIGKQAFVNCDALESISVPNGVTEIGSRAFEDCNSLNAVELGTSVKALGYSAFAYCDALTGIELPESLVNIGDAAFIGSGLTSIVIPNGVTKIGSETFAYTYQLESVEIPNSVTEIGNGAFEECVFLEEVRLPSNLNEIASYTFFGCQSLNSITIPDTVETIGYEAFASCISLNEVNGANGVIYVENGAFEGTPFAEDSSNYDNGIFYIGNAIYDVDYDINGAVVVKSGVKVIPRYTFSGTNITSIVIPEGVECIEYGAFAGCENLSSVVLPSTLKVIESNAFEYCTSLKNIDFPEGLECIGYNAFYGSGLESIKIPNTVTDIVYATFGSTNVSDVDLPDTPVSIDKNVVSNTPWSEEQSEGLVYADNVVLMGYNGTMPENTTVTVKDGTLTIAGYAFDSEQNLIDVNIANTVEIICNYAFYNTGLTSVELPDSVKTIEEGAFLRNKNLTSVNLGKTEVLGASVFAYCPALTYINLGTGLKEIGASVFAGTPITTLNIPASVEKIDVAAFAGCTTLEAINVDANNQYYSSIDGILYNKEGTKVIYCPASKTGVVKLGLDVTEIANGAFGVAKVDKIIVENTAIEIGSYAFSSSNGYNFTEINSILLCAAEGSTTQSYASKYGQPFEVKGKTVLEDDKITVENKDESAFEGIELNVDIVSEIETEIIFDITLMRGDEVVQPSGDVIVKIPVPKSMKNGDVKVYHRDDRGNYHKVDAKHVDGHMVFTVNHFSEYVLTTEEKEVASYVLGDVNGDGKITAIDARWTLQYSANNRELTDVQVLAADVNGDGKVTAIDARWILQASAGNRVL